MRRLRKKIYAAAGYNTIYMGPGRKEFNPRLPQKEFDAYLKECGQGTCQQMENPHFDEGVIGSFMSACFINQANLPGFLPFMVPSLLHKPCTAVEGACGTGGRAIASAARAILSDLSDAVFVAAFEMQNQEKAVYGADRLAGAGFYKKERKGGWAHFFPGIFAERAGAYYERYGYEKTREAMAEWYAQAIQNARKNSKAQEYHNTIEDLVKKGMTPPNAETFVPYLNFFDCSKVTDGASSIALFSEEGLARCGVNKANAVEIVGIGGAEGNITKAPDDLTILSTTEAAVQKALEMAEITIEEVSVAEVHDCFSITGLLALEAMGVAKKGGAPSYVLEGKSAIDGKLPVNPSGGLVGFGHPTGASGVRQLVDLLYQSTGCAENPINMRTPYGLMISMGGNDKTVTAVVTKAP